MQKLINFISAKNPKESAIFKELQCSKEEAILLQRIIYRYVSGIEEVAVLELLQEIYGSEPQNYLNKLELIQNLIEMDWIVLVDFENQYQNNNEHSKLEILSSEIAPSNALLKLLENGNTQETNEDIKPYSNQIEYLQDQFERIDLMQRITLSKAIFSRGTKSKSKLRNKLIQLEALIDQKLSITKDKIDIEEFFKREKLNRIEKIIFLALLKEEYRGGEGPLRNLENLIDLVSSNEAEKIKNRLFFESNSLH
ncbi:MAG: hypothetical protein GXO02_05615 [Epsilonproteobacteria bacterium]|nr:hypothetical protein [Campylobacterota bacterium]